MSEENNTATRRPMRPFLFVRSIRACDRSFVFSLAQSSAASKKKKAGRSAARARSREKKALKKQKRSLLAELLAHCAEVPVSFYATHHYEW